MPSTGEQINKQCYIHTMEYCSAMKKNKLLMYMQHVTTWIALKHIMLTGRNQMLKAIYEMISFICHAEKGKTRDRNQIST